MGDRGREVRYAETLQNRHKIRASFVHTEKEESQSYISDLEETLKLNKEIIRDLCGSQGTDKALAKLNTENTKQRDEILRLKKAKCDVEARELILTQMIEEYKTRELEHERDLLERTNELKDQINRKEYMAQIVEKRCRDAENMILKHLHFVPEAMRLVTKFSQQPFAGMPITNLVEANEKLVAEKLQLERTVVRMQEELFDSKKEAENLKTQNDSLKAKLETMSKECEELRQSLPVLHSIPSDCVGRDLSFGGLSNVSGKAQIRRTDSLSPNMLPRSMSRKASGAAPERASADGVVRIDD